MREKDLPEAPPEPPPTGYVVFVGQMTTKIRHDRPNVPHDQAKGEDTMILHVLCNRCARRYIIISHLPNSQHPVLPRFVYTLWHAVVQEISKIWKIGMSALDRAYYNTFAIDAKREYEQQVVEYRATGSFTPSTEFGKLEGVNVWVRRKFQNGLEREISAYSTCLFPKRPKEMDEAYEKREERSKLKRKLKLKGLLNDDGSLKKGLDFEVLLEEERAKERTKRVGTEDSSITATMNNEQQIGNDRNETDRAGK